MKVKKIGIKNEYVAMVTEAEYQTMQTHSFLAALHGKTSGHKGGLQAPLYGRSYGIFQSGSHGDVPPGKPLSD